MITTNSGLTTEGYIIYADYPMFTIQVLEEVLENFCVNYNYELIKIKSSKNKIFEYLIKINENFIYLKALEFWDKPEVYTVENNILLKKYVNIAENFLIDNVYYKRIRFYGFHSQDKIYITLQENLEKIKTYLNHSPKKCNMCKQSLEFCYCYKPYTCTKCNKKFFYTGTFIKNNELIYSSTSKYCQGCTYDLSK